MKLRVTVEFELSYKDLGIAKLDRLAKAELIEAFKWELEYGFGAEVPLYEPSYAIEGDHTVSNSVRNKADSLTGSIKRIGKPKLKAI